MFLILMFIFLMSRTANAASLVQVNSPECVLHGTLLKCDYGFVKENVVLDSQSSDIVQHKVNSIHIHNVNKLVISRPLCLDANFHSINVIHFANVEACSKRLVSIRLFDSTSNSVPRQLLSLDMLRSEIQRVNCDLGLQRFFISQSKITEFNAPWPIGGAFSIKIEHSYFEKFTALNIEQKVYLFITNSTFKLIAKEGLILGNGATASIMDSTVNGIDKSVIIKTGARLIIKDTEGKLIIEGPTSDQEYLYQKSPPGVPHKTITPPPDVEEQDNIETGQDHPGPDLLEPTCKSPYTAAWLIPTVVATVEALILIVMCGKKFPKKRKPSVGPDSESPENLFNVRADSQPFRDSSMYYQGLQSSAPIIRRR